MSAIPMTPVLHGLDPTHLAPPEVIPDLTTIQTDDGAPVDNIFVAEQQYILVDAIKSSWSGPRDGRPYLITADVGLFHTANQPPIVPDVMLSLDVLLDDPLHKREHRSYFVWLVGKVPDVVIEIVSQIPNDEDTTKMRTYARMRIPYYVIFDPGQFLSTEELRIFQLGNDGYEPLPSGRFKNIGLGMIIEENTYAGIKGRWLRWTDASGSVLALGRERADAETQRADAEKWRADSAEERTREMEAKLAQYADRMRNAGLSTNGS